MADLQRKTENLFDETYTGLTTSLTYFPIYVGDGNFTLSTTTPNNPTGASLFFLRGQASSGASSSANGVWEGQSRTVTALNGYITIAYRYNEGVYVNPKLYDTMLNTGSTALPYEPYWQHSLRKLCSATEAVETPLYSDGTAISTYTIKGNTVQDGTPTPSNPITVSGVGNKTANLLPPPTAAASGEINGITYSIDKYGICTFSGTATADIDISYDLKSDFTIPISVGAGGHGVVAFNNNISTSLIANFMYNQTQIDNWNMIATNRTHSAYTSMGNKTINRIRFTATSGSNLDGLTVAIAFSNNDVPVSPFEPWGYKIPISSGGTTTPVYLGEVQSTRQIQKLVLTGQENWTYDATYTRFVITISGITRYGTRDTPFYCTHYQVISDGRPIADVPNNATYLVATVTDTATLNIKTDSYTSADDFKAFLSNQYANGTPVTVYYVLATATTDIVNEPLMKIGTYADSISNAVSIPTTEGANIITVDTTVQPSEFSATWTGWHNATVKEWDGTDWQ